MPLRRPLLALLLAGAALGCSPAPAGALRLVPVGTFDQPVEVRGVPGDPTRLIVVEQAGTVRMVRDGAVLPEPFLDLTGPVLAGGERGLLSVVLAPDWATSGLLYVYYTADAPSGAISVAEYRRSASDPDRADPATARNLLTIPHDRQSNHNGGHLAFDVSGLLWISTGDGGSGGDPAGNGQNLSASGTVVSGVNREALLGKLLRIDPRPGRGCGGACTIPAGQPIAPGAAGEIFGYGLRNPWRWSFDRASGDLVVADVGQNAWEEVSHVPAAALAPGLNFGWRRLEGDALFDAGATLTPPGTTAIDPAVTHAHADGWCSITGGFVARDPALPELTGRYLYGDFCLGAVRAVRLGDASAGGDAALPLPQVPSLSSFGEDDCGRLYVASLGGAVARIAPDSGGPPSCAASTAPPAGGGPGPVAAAADRRPPGLALTATRRTQRLRGRALVVGVRCDEACVVEVRGRLRVRPGANASASWARLRTVRRLGAADRGTLVRIPLGPAARRAAARRLRLGRTVTAALDVRATDAAGNARRRTLSVRVRP